MRKLNSIRVLIILLVCSIAMTGVVLEFNARARASAGGGYVCPPCGCGKDEEISEQPGRCTACGMTLVEKGSEASKPRPEEPQQARKRVAILIFNGVEIIDYAGPYEVFGQAGFDVYTVAARPGQITTAMGMKVTPSYSLGDSPQPDVLVIPGGDVFNTQEDPAVLKWIQEQSKRAEHVLSVCNGAFILARTGLLDGLTATTFYNLVDGLPAVAPKTKVVRDQRYVDNGKIITTAGISSGIDGSLYVVSKMRSKAAAQMVALNMEYNWRPDSSYARASFADRHLRRIMSARLVFPVPAGDSLKVLNTEGDAGGWRVRWEVAGSAPAAEVIRLINKKLADEGKWSRRDIKDRGEGRSAWQFTDENGEPWQGDVRVAPAVEKDTLIVDIEVLRAGSRQASSR